MSGKINAIDQLRLSLNILSRDDVLKIHTATLEVIESIGVRFPSHKALNILDAVVLLRNVSQNPSEAFDFNGDGKKDVLDVLGLILFLIANQ